MQAAIGLLKYSLIVVAVGYLAAMIYMWAMQRSYLYYPDKNPLVAADLKVPDLSDVTLETADGETLQAFYIAPKSDDAPIFLFFSGNGGTLQQWRGRWARIEAAGAGVLAVSYRGYAGSTGTPTEAGLHMDADAGWDWLTERFGEDRIVIHGFSLGSGVATRLASEHEFRALILEAPYTSVQDRAAEAIWFMPTRWLVRDTFRSRDWITEIDKPILIYAGTADRVITSEMSADLHALAGDNAKLIITEGGDHSTGPRDGLYDHIWTFLNWPEKPASPD